MIQTVLFITGVLVAVEVQAQVAEFGSRSRLSPSAR